MAAATRPIPQGFHTITPSLIVAGAKEAIAFYEKAFGAKLLSCHMGPDGKRVMHSELQLGDSKLMVNDEYPEMGAFGPKGEGRTPTTLHLYVEDVDKVFNQAVAAGAKATMPVMDAFWGDRYGQLVDPFGHHWSIGTHKEDLTPDEMNKRAEQAFAQSDPNKPCP